MNKLLGTFIVVIMIYDYNKYLQDKIETDILCYCKQVQCTLINHNSFIAITYSIYMC